MWDLEPRTALERAVAGLALLTAVAGAVRLEEIGELLRREEARAWWAGNGRDVINALALLAIAAALVLRGFPPPAALAASGLLTLALTGVSTLEGRLPAQAHPRATALGIGLLLALPLVAWPGGISSGLGAVAAALFADR